MVQTILGWLMVAIAVVLAFVDIPFALLAILVIGLVSGFMNPLEDVGTRVAYYVLAAVLPTIANNLDQIPALGGYLNSILDTFAVGIAGVALANFCLAVVNNLMSSDSAEGDS